MRITRKRIWFGLACLLLALGTTSSALILTREQSKVNKANFDKLEEGMTKVQVECILGSRGTEVDYISNSSVESMVYESFGPGPKTTIIVSFSFYWTPNGTIGKTSATNYHKETIPEFVSRLRRQAGF
jgi:outer membrane protein assembly factor BamE (lipoprotein component of BamABCDE complex)